LFDLFVFEQELNQSQNKNQVLFSPPATLAEKIPAPVPCNRLSQPNCGPGGRQEISCIPDEI